MFAVNAVLVFVNLSCVTHTILQKGSNLVLSHSVYSVGRVTNVGGRWGGGSRLGRDVVSQVHLTENKEEEYFRINIFRKQHVGVRILY